MLTQKQGEEVFLTHYNPRYPFHSPDPQAHGIWRSKRSTALEDIFIEPTARSAQNTLTIDLDLYEGEDTILTMAYDDESIPAPNFIVTNKATLHCHATWFIDGVLTTEKSKQAGAYIQQKLTTKIGADLAFTNRLIRNPLHHQHSTRWEHGDSLKLQEFNAYLEDVETQKLQQSIIDKHGVYLGRNHQVFRQLADWSYTQRYKYTSYSQWVIILAGKARDIQEYANPNPTEQLNRKEMNTIIRSVADWTWKNISQDNYFQTAEFKQTQSIRGKRSAKARIEKAEQDYVLLLNLMDEGATNRELAEIFNITINAVKKRKQRATQWVESVHTGL